jgi:DNA-binding MarR family transcriptional regulator
MPQKNQPEAMLLTELPGHAIRRLHQIAVGLFHQELQPLNLTPVQFGALQTIENQPFIDQRTLARLIALDTSTTASVVDRLEARGLLTRSFSESDKRVRLLSLTKDGHALCAKARPLVQQSQVKILEPLTASQRKTFMELLTVLLDENNAYSRAWSEKTRKIETAA